jgi:hypothetical protein
MRRIILGGALALSMGVTAAAQDSEVRSRTEIKADDARTVSMTGCLQRDVAGTFSLYGTAVTGRDGVTTETKVRTENDRDESKVTTTTSTKTDDGRVGTSGTLVTFLLTPREGVSLAPHVGQQVQISAVKVDRDSGDAEVKIEEKTTVDADDADSRSRRTKTEIEVERAPAGHYTVVSVKALGSACK